MRVLITRAAEDAASIAARLEAMGHEPVLEPLLRPDYLADPIDLADARTLILTSRHALEALARQPAALAGARRLKAAAVGAATAARAGALGLSAVLEGPGTAAELADLISKDRSLAAPPYLHLSGDEVAFDLVGQLVAAGIAARREVVYRMTAAGRLSEATRELVADGRIGAVILMSPRTARVYAGVIAAAGLGDAIREVRHICLSAAVAAPLAPFRLRHISVPAHPSLEALLGLLS